MDSNRAVCLSLALTHAKHEFKLVIYDNGWGGGHYYDMAGVGDIMYDNVWGR